MLPGRTPYRSSRLKKRRGTTRHPSKKNPFNNVDEVTIVRLLMMGFLFIILVIGYLYFTQSTTILPNFGKSKNDNVNKSNRGNIVVDDDSSNKLRGSIAMPNYNESAYLEFFPYTFDTTFDMESYTPKGGDRFTEWKDGDTPYEINDDVTFASDIAARIRKEHVKASMKHAWNGYKKYAFGHDEVNPVTGTYNDRWTGIGTTLVDSLDTLWLMDMKEEFYEARDWVRGKLNFDKNKFTSVFETTIRSLGGLLGAYDWSGDPAFLEKAVDLGDRLFKAFNTLSGIPYGEINLYTGKGRNEIWLGKEVSLSAGTTLQVEFRYLAKVTGNTAYAKKAEFVFEAMKKMEPDDGLYPASVVNLDRDPRLGRREPKISFGSRADSFYEYMLKIWLQGNRREQMYRDMYDKSIQGMHDTLLQKGTESGLWYIAQTTFRRKSRHYINPSMDHLVCFMGGLLALGAYTDPNGLESERAQRDLHTGKALTYSCYQMYAATKTGLSPEIVANWETKPSPERHALHYILRPETVESFFVLYQLTKDPIYREWGWEIYQSIEKYCKTGIAYGHFPNVENEHEKPEDNLESFFMGETLKYLYLLFDPDTEVDILNTHVFNTEAHPLRLFSRLHDESN